MPNKSNDAESKSKDMSLAETAYHKIKQDILKNKFPSGEFISISDLSESLEGMGRTPVREAVQRLHDERLLIVVPRKGIIIPEFDIKKMMDQLELRFVLEKYATIKAAAKIDEAKYRELEELIGNMENAQSLGTFQLAKLNMDFHMKIVETVNNHELIQVLSHIYDHHIRIYTFFLADKMRVKTTSEEHRGIIKALRSGDPVQIGDAINLHYENTRRELLDSIMT